jgi:hypothetical protein
VDDEPQSQDELAAHFGEAGPVAAAERWIRLIQRGDLKGAWPHTDPSFRLVLVQLWLWANRDHPRIAFHDRDEAATALAGVTFEHDLWPEFESTQLEEFEAAWDDFNLEEWGAASRPRPVPPDCELVLFVDTGGKVMMVDRPTLVRAHGFLMRWEAEPGSSSGSARTAQRRVGLQLSRLRVSARLTKAADHKTPTARRSGPFLA